MKLFTLLLLMNYFSIAIAQEKNKFTLETRDKHSIYVSKKQLNLEQSVSKLKSMEQVKGFESFQVNTSASSHNIVGDAANEPSLAVNPLNPNQIAVGWRQFNTVASSFRQAGKSHSNDGGKTWNYQQVFEPGVFRSDPVLESDADGHFYYQSLQVSNDSQGNNTFFVDQWKSYNGGKTWIEKTYAFGGDKSWMAIDKTNGIGRGNLYAAWNVAGNQFAPSTYNRLIAGEANFSTPVEIPSNPIFGTLDVGQDANLYIVGTDGYADDLSSFYLVKSANPSLTVPFFHQTTKVNLAGPIRIGGIVNDFGLDGQIYVKLDKSNRSSKNNVYILASTVPEGIDPLDVHFVRSTDGGISFSEPRRINSDVAGNWQWFGTMSVAPNGRIDVIWNDTRAADGSIGNNFFSTLYYTYSYDAGMTFVKEQAITPEFNHLLGYPVQRKMGDYIDMESDNIGAHIVYTATFNGEQDVYYMYAKPSAIEENPDFPTILTNNAWSVSGVPSQGILSSTLIDNSQSENPLLAFEAIFTAKPDGTPMWLVATGEIPKQSDSFSLPLYMPTGDLTENGTPLLAIGSMTKRRLRDENNELIDNKIEYVFDMSNDAITFLEDFVLSSYDEAFFNNNPFHGIQKTLTFDSLLPREQLRKDLCNINAQVLSSVAEKNEGRVQFTYLRDEILNLFAADFTYIKVVNEDGNAVIELDNNGLATPIWEVIQSNEQGVLADNSVENHVFTPNGGLGFFESGGPTGITDRGEEQVIANANQLITTKPDKTVETMNVLANNAYCGDYWKNDTL